MKIDLLPFRIRPASRKRFSVVSYCGRKVTGRATLLALLALAGGFTRAQAQDVRINVGLTSAKPGDPIDIPMTLSGGSDVEVKQLTARISFPKDSLSFQDVEAALAAELADAVVTAKVQEHPDRRSHAVLALTVVGQQPVKPGIIAYLKFRVAPDAVKGDIALDLLDSSATNPDGSQMELAEGDDGFITLFSLDEDIPVIGCFFFTH
jgi:hypothetical protein